ncbi:transcription termination factor 1-like [Acipenser oxyrinchus oxyrinchus]|uniref:Transcription termination factor 1-like n=1 Tax=Acipenser oxyrinchus oxyrinchus TaxID=40147 RepID=A0AAD8FW53_ACIOX|nr:transcription termination factor 1-like [Acipenser oxyrinchus oxyrinchus]
MTRGSEGEATPRKRKRTEQSVPALSLSPLLFEDGTGEDTESSAAAQEHKKKKKKKKVKEKRAEHEKLKEAGERDGGHKKKKVKSSDGDENLEAEMTEEVEIPMKKKKKKKKHKRDEMEQEGESNDDVNPSGQPKDEESCLEAVGSERKKVKVEIKGSYPVTPWTAEEKKRKQREAGLKETGQGASDQSSRDLSAKKKKKQKATNSIQVPPSGIDEPVEASSSEDPGRQVDPTRSSSKMKKRRSDVDEPAERSGVDPGQSPGGSGKEKKLKMVNQSQLLETSVNESGESVIVSWADLIQTPGGSRKKTKHEIVNQSQEPQLGVENPKAASWLSSTEILCGYQEKKKKKKKRGIKMKDIAVRTADDDNTDGWETGQAKSSRVGEEELASMMEQLKEFVPNVEKLSAAVIVGMAKYDLNRFREFKKKGMAIRSGRFTAEENDRLRKNVEDFLSLAGIDCPQKLFYSARYPEEISTLKQLKVQYRFWTRICEGIPRAKNLIYKRGRKMFDELNYKGRYTEEEEASLKRFHTLYGNNWIKIADLVGRSEQSVALKVSTFDCKNKGRWSYKERRILLKVMEDELRKTLDPAEMTNLEQGATPERNSRLLTIIREKLYQNIHWVDVAAKVKTRNWVQCRQKWMHLLTYRMSQGEAMSKSNKCFQAKINLINRLYSMNVEDQNDIDWEDLTDIFGDVPPYCVQRMFTMLKVSHVPMWKSKPFGDIIDFLHENTVPVLKEKISKSRRHDKEGVRDSYECHKTFNFSDIFYESDTDLETEESDQET